ncbi:MAG: carboxylesterase family protein [Pseudomonadota bacterium]
MGTILKWVVGILVLLALALGALVFILTRPAAPLEPADQVVAIAQGSLQGGIDRDNPEILQFNGVPYAAPPVGDLRWRPPAEPVAWEGVRQAQAFGAECLQARGGSAEFVRDLVKGLGLAWWKQQLAGVVTANMASAPESEDCLFLNIRTANTGSEDLRPVMVWIHGGSHQSGAGSHDLYQANQLVENGVVLVTINYRLGPLGYLAHPALSADDPRGVSGNYGLLDQMAALAWVRANIEPFGGDPANITVFGESAGAQSVSEMMASPASEGLFHKAILQSGSSTYRSVGLTTALDGRPTAHEVGAELLDGLASAGATAVDLRAIDGADIIAAIGEHPELIDYLKPVVDGEVLPRMVGDAILNDGIPAIPMLMGYNGDEATLFYADTQAPTVLKAPFPEDMATRFALLEEIYGPEDALRLRTLYGLDEPDEWDQGAMDMLGDDIFGVHMRTLAKENSAAGAPTWLYHFTRIPPSPRQTLGAFHASEIFFVFNSHSPLMDLTENDWVITEAMGAYWAAFATHGDPNLADLATWPAYGANDRWMTFPTDEAPRPVQGVRAEKLDIMERVLRERVADAIPVLTPDPAVGSGGQEAGADSLQP